MDRLRPAAAVCLALAIGASACNSSSGLLSCSGTHRMLRSAQRISRAAQEPQPLPRELDKDVMAEYRVEPGDELLVEPIDPSSTIRLPGDQPVQPDGKINLGRYGRLAVAGLTVDEIRSEVEELVGRETNKSEPILVRLVDAESQVYYVFGEVHSPGAYPLKGRETVLDALVAAGDLTDRANPHRILLSRPTGPHQCRAVLPICYHRIVQLGDTATNYQVFPGDRVFVASRTFWEGLLQACIPDAGDRCTRCDCPEVPCVAAGSGESGCHME